MRCAEKADKYMSKFTRAIAMTQALSSVRNRIRLGDWLTVKEYTGSSTGERRTLSGRVCYVNEHYFTIQTKNYRESFTWINVVLGQVEVV